MINLLTALLAKGASVGVAAKAGVAAVVVATSTATAGVAGVLPEPIQQPFSAVTSLGVEAPAEEA